MCQDCWENHLSLLTSGFVALDRGPGLVSALEMGNLSPCHVFHPVLIYSCLREEGKGFLSLQSFAM